MEQEGSSTAVQSFSNAELAQGMNPDALTPWLWRRMRSDRLLPDPKLEYQTVHHPALPHPAWTDCQFSMRLPALEHVHGQLVIRKVVALRCLADIAPEDTMLRLWKVWTQQRLLRWRPALVPRLAEAERERKIARERQKQAKWR